MKIYQQIKAVERNYNTYKLTHDEAMVKVKPLIKQFNDKSRELAKKHNQRPKLLNLKRLAFN